MSYALGAFKVAAVQAAPVYLDQAGTVEKVCGLIREAGRAGAQLIAFPEVLVPGFPHWIYLDRPQATEDLFVELVRQAVDVPGPATERIGAAAREAGAYVVVGVNERSSRSVAELFNTNLIFAPDGTLLGKHRKLMPTYAEKMIWSFGDGSTLRVYDTACGRLGTLCCGENTNPLARFALIAQGEQVHVANYPARPAGDAYDLRRAIELRSAAHAFEGKCFVIVAGSVISAAMRERLGTTAERRKLLGATSTTFTAVLGPDGRVIGGPAPGDDETIVYADVDLSASVRPKLMHDVAGSYNRFDVLSLNLDRAPLQAIRFDGDDAAAAPARPLARRSVDLDRDPARGIEALGAAGVPAVFADAVRTELPDGAMLSISGMVALDESKKLVGSTMREQTRQVLENIRRVVEHEGGTMADIVRVRVYVTRLDPDSLREIHAVRAEYWSPGRYPASTLVGVTRLVRDGALIEIDADAVLPTR